MRPSHLFLAILILLLSTAAGCARPAEEWQGLLKIGLVAPFSGYDAGTAARMLGAIKARVDGRNQAGGVRGYRLELVALDDGNEPEAATARAGELAVDPDVLAAVVRLSGDGDRVPAAYQRAGLPLLVIGGPLEVPERSTGLWQLCASATAEGTRAARFAADEVGMQRAAVVALGGDGFAAAARAFAQVLASQGKAPAPSNDWGRERRLSNEQTDQLAREIAGADADFVYFSGPYESGAMLASALARSTNPVVLLGSDAATTGLGPLLPRAASRLAFVASCLAGPVGRQDDPGATSRSSGDAEEESRAVLAADAAEYIMEAADGLARGGRPTRAEIDGALSRLRSDTDGAARFDRTGRRLDAAVGVRWLVDDRAPDGDKR